MSDDPRETLMSVADRLIEAMAEIPEKEEDEEIEKLME